MKTFKIIAIFSFLIFISSVSLAKMYKWVDEKGVTHYSNTPQALPSKGVEATVEAKSKGKIQKPESQISKTIEEPKENENSKTDTKPSSVKPTPQPTLEPKAKYKFTQWNIDQKGDYVNVSGRVEGGNPCDKLKVDVFLQNEKGNTSHVICTIKVNSYGSSLLRGKDRVFTKGKRWTVTDVYTKCLD